MNTLKALSYSVENDGFCDMSDVGRFDNTWSKNCIDRTEHEPNLNLNRQCRYYHSPNEAYDDNRETLFLDYQRAMEISKGERWFVGVKASAVFTPKEQDGISTPLSATMESVGCWGIEVDGSDEDIEHLQSVAKEEFDDLKVGLSNMSVDLSEWNHHLSKALEKK